MRALPVAASITAAALAAASIIATALVAASAADAPLVAASVAAASFGAAVVAAIVTAICLTVDDSSNTPSNGALVAGGCLLAGGWARGREPVPVVPGECESALFGGPVVAEKK